MIKLFSQLVLAAIVLVYNHLHKIEENIKHFSQFCLILLSNVNYEHVKKGANERKEKLIQQERDKKA